MSGMNQVLISEVSECLADVDCRWQLSLSNADVTFWFFATLAFGLHA